MGRSAIWRWMSVHSATGRTRWADTWLSRWHSGWPARVSGLILTGSSGLFERSFSRNVPHVPSREYVRAKMEEIFYDPALVTPSWVEAVRRIVTTRATALRVLQFARAARRDRFHGLIPDAELVYITN